MKLLNETHAPLKSLEILEHISQEMKTVMILDLVELKERTSALRNYWWSFSFDRPKKGYDCEAKTGLPQSEIHPLAHGWNQLILNSCVWLQSFWRTGLNSLFHQFHKNNHLPWQAAKRSRYSNSENRLGLYITWIWSCHSWLVSHNNKAGFSISRLLD